MNDQWFYTFLVNSVITLLAIPVVSVVQAPLLSLVTSIVTRVWLPIRYSWWVLIRTNAACFAAVLGLLLLIDMLALEREISPNFSGIWLEFALRWQGIVSVALIQFVHFVSMRKWIQYPARGLEELSWLQTVLVLVLYNLAMFLALTAVFTATGSLIR